MTASPTTSPETSPEASPGTSGADSGPGDTPAAETSGAAAAADERETPRDPPQPAEADAAVASLTRMEHVEDLLDDDALSSRLGLPVRGRHVRIKPEHSVVMAWERTDVDLSAPEPPEGPAHHGWTGVSRDTDKYAKALARAERVGHQLTIHHEDPVYLISGSMWTDRVLGRELAEAREALGPQARWTVLRYNPRRRVVAVVELDGASHVVRVTGQQAAAQLDTADRWRRLGVPMEPLRPLGARGTAVIAPLWGLGDLLQHPSEAAAETAGLIFAELHARSGELAEVAEGTEVAEVTDLPTRELTCEVTEAVQAIGLVAPWLGRRAQVLAEALGPLLQDAAEGAELVELHGDLSPDQVLVSDAAGSRVRVIDLDRAGQGPAMRDVGSWTASCRAADHLELAEAFLRGYREVAPVDEESRHAWEAYAHLRAAVDPFRRREENWPQQASGRISLAEQALQG